MSERNTAADVSAISNAIGRIGESLHTQEAAVDNEELTKINFVLPFLRDVLGYNIENSHEVREECTADIGNKKKVDIAICNDDSEQTPRILIECKKLGADLTQENFEQLWGYFVASPSAHFGILTNGRLWKLYTDMDNDNLMDPEPYAILNVCNPDPDVIALLQHLTKEGFDSNKAREDAERYCKMGLMRQCIHKELSDPSSEFVKLFIERLKRLMKDKSRLTPTMVETYRPLVVAALKEYTNQRGAEESDDAAAMRTGTAEPGEAEQEQPKRERSDSSVKMQDLVKAGLLHDGDELIHATRGRYQDVVATVRGDGKIEIEGQSYDSPSTAAESVTDSSWDGWIFWRLLDGRTLDDLRDAYGRGSSVHD